MTKSSKSSTGALRMFFDIVWYTAFADSCVACFKVLDRDALCRRFWRMHCLQKSAEQLPALILTSVSVSVWAVVDPDDYIKDFSADRLQVKHAGGVDLPGAATGQSLMPEDACACAFFCSDFLTALF